MLYKFFSLIIIISTIFTYNSCKGDLISPNIDLVNDNSSLKEIFPISIGKNYLYSYYHHLEYRTSPQYSKDFGSIQYVILDSIKLSDTTVQWKIKQIQHFYHSQIINKGSASDFIPKDTTYLIDTTNIFSLEENLKGFHQLKCKSVAWTFPFVEGYASSDHNESSISKVSRYSNENKYLFTFKESVSSTSVSDTLSLYENKGMEYFRRDISVYLISGYNDTLKIKLMD